MAISTFGIIVCAILSFLILPEAPKEISKLKRFSIFLQWILLPVTLIVFGSIPALDAQTRLLFGKYMEFWTTEKYRKNE
jgi:O-antigen/teichoic acid export membrane protein